MTDEKHADTGKASNGQNGTSNGSRTRSRRTSALMAVAQSLPTVESSLEDFIARANATLVDVGGWGLGEEQLRAEREQAERGARDAEAARIREAQDKARAEARAEA
ncbi:MAG: hypothetical protein KC464_24450, partial [Myxococcales bacterium]|nr:hypothetical protein [Myxococcales bacterium]